MGDPPPESLLPPGLATPARLACFDRAAFVRQRRDEIVAAIADGDTSLDALFDGDMTGVGAPSEPTLVDDATIVASTKILPLLEAVPHMGKVTSRRLLAGFSILPSTRVERLDATERNAVLVAIDDHLVDQQLAAQYSRGLAAVDDSRGLAAVDAGRGLPARDDNRDLPARDDDRDLPADDDALGLAVDDDALGLAAEGERSSS